jgi:hypothetical protein
MHKVTCKNPYIFDEVKQKLLALLRLYSGYYVSFTR